jgi:hypothetical protein
MGQTCLQQGFCIDTSALIDMTNYPQDVFSGLWVDMGLVADNGLLISPKQVYVEIGKEYEEDLQKWAQNHLSMFVPLDEDQFEMAQAIIRDFPKLVDVNKTIPDADPFVIALALSKGEWVVVTSETFSLNKYKPKIPNVCKSLNIKYINLHDLFRECKFHYG